MPYSVIQKFKNADILEVLKAASWTSIFKGMSIFFSFFSSMIMARLYGASNIGQLSIGLTITDTAMMLVKLGTDISIVRLIAASRMRGDTRSIRMFYGRVLSILLPVSIVVGIAIFMGSSYIATYIFNKPLLAMAIGVIAWRLPFLALDSVSTASLRGIKKIKLWSALQSMGMPVLTLLSLLTITFLIVRGEMTPIYAAVTAAATMAILSTSLWIYSLKKLKQEPGRESVVEQPSRWAILLLSFPMFITSSMNFILNTSDKFFLGIFASTADVGIYHIVLRLSGIAGVTLFAVNSIILPKFAELHATGDHVALSNLAKFSEKLTFLLTLPFVIPLIFFSGSLLAFFGKEFVGGSSVLILLSLGQLINAGCGSNDQLLNMTGHQKVLQYIMISVAALNLILNFLLVPTYGIVGAAIAKAMSIACYNGAASIAIYRIFGYWLFSLPRFNVSP